MVCFKCTVCNTRCTYQSVVHRPLSCNGQRLRSRAEHISSLFPLQYLRSLYSSDIKWLHRSWRPRPRLELQAFWLHPGPNTPAAGPRTNQHRYSSPDDWVWLHSGPSSNLLEKGSWRWTIAAAIPGPVCPLPIFSEEMTRSTPSLSSGWLARFSKFGPCH